MKNCFKRNVNGGSFAANAQEITFAMEPGYPPFETTNEKVKLSVLMWM